MPQECFFKNPVKSPCVNTPSSSSPTCFPRNASGGEVTLGPPRGCRPHQPLWPRTCPRWKKPRAPRRACSLLPHLRPHSRGEPCAAFGEGAGRSAKDPRSLTSGRGGNGQATGLRSGVLGGREGGRGGEGASPSRPAAHLCCAEELDR